MVLIFTRFAKCSYFPISNLYEYTKIHETSKKTT